MEGLQKLRGNLRNISQQHQIQATAVSKSSFITANRFADSRLRIARRFRVPELWGVLSGGIRDPNAFKTRLKCICSEKNKGRWKTQGREKHTISPLPKHGFGPPHL